MYYVYYNYYTVKCHFSDHSLCCSVAEGQENIREFRSTLNVSLLATLSDMIHIHHYPVIPCTTYSGPRGGIAAQATLKISVMMMMITSLSEGGVYPCQQQKLFR